jgi:hypothetical protein
MRELVDRITIDCTPNKVYNTLVFFFQNSENYKLWHNDHISCHWKKGNNFSPGSILIAEEYLHGFALRLGFKILNSEPDIGFDYKVLFPSSLICSGGSFRMIPAGTKTELVARLNFRFDFILNILFKKIIDSLRIHMKEEGISIKGLIEKNRQADAN